MTSLYELTEDLVALNRLLEELGGDVTDGTQGQTLERWAEEFDWKLRDKVDGYATIIRNIEGDALLLEEEITRLQNRKRVLDNRVARLKALAKYSMERLGTRKMEGLKFTLALQKAGGQDPLELLVEDVEQFPSRFLRIRKEADKDALRKALVEKDPEAARLARLGERGDYVRVR